MENFHKNGKIKLVESKDALEQIIQDLKNNDFEISIHGLLRMAERSLTAQDILALIASDAIHYPVWSEAHQSWNFSGKGLTRDNFVIACVYEERTLIVTVFWE